METLGLPSPCTKVNMYKSNYVQENSCTSRGNGNPWITLTMYKGKYVQESSCTSRGNRILLKVSFKPVKKKTCNNCTYSKSALRGRCWGLNTPGLETINVTDPGEAQHKYKYSYFEFIYLFRMIVKTNKQA